MQHQLTNSLTFQLGYVGQRGAHLLNFQDNAQSVPLNAQGQDCGSGRSDRETASRALSGRRNTRLVVFGRQSPIQCAAVAEPPATRPCGKEALAGTNMSNSDQKYNALQAVLQKRMGNGLAGSDRLHLVKVHEQLPRLFRNRLRQHPRYQFRWSTWVGKYLQLRVWIGDRATTTRPTFVTSYVTYALPVGHGKQFGHDMNPVLNGIVGNWEIG